MYMLWSEMDTHVFVWAQVKLISAAHSGVILIILIAVITVIIDTDHALNNFGWDAIKSSWEEEGGIRLGGGVMTRRTMKIMIFQQGDMTMWWYDSMMMTHQYGIGAVHIICQQGYVNSP